MMVGKGGGTFWSLSSERLISREVDQDILKEDEILHKMVYIRVHKHLNPSALLSAVHKAIDY